jgi:hypothetical protein
MPRSCPHLATLPPLFEGVVNLLISHVHPECSDMKMPFLFGARHVDIGAFEESGRRPHSKTLDRCFADLVSATGA